MLFECFLLVGEKMCINIFEMIKKLLKIDYQMAFKKKKIYEKGSNCCLSVHFQIDKIQVQRSALHHLSLNKSREGKKGKLIVSLA